MNDRPVTLPELQPLDNPPIVLPKPDDGWHSFTPDQVRDIIRRERVAAVLADRAAQTAQPTPSAQGERERFEAWFFSATPQCAHPKADMDRLWVAWQAALAAPSATRAKAQPSDEAFPAPGAAHSNHPQRHYDRTCGACIAERDWEAMNEPPVFDGAVAQPEAPAAREAASEYVMVPREPTRNMLNARHRCGLDASPKDLWRAMLAAAPIHPADPTPHHEASSRERALEEAVGLLRYLVKTHDNTCVDGIDIGYVRTFLTAYDSATAPQAPSPSICDHEWIDARNKVIKSGEVCNKCWMIRAAQPPKATSGRDA